MAKYSFELKKKTVLSYLNDEGALRHIADKYGVSDKSDVRKWVSAYNEFGSEGLIRKRKNQTYSFEFKFHVVELYLTTEVSYQDLALSVGINNPSLITKWVNDFRIAGPDALRPKQKGRKPKVNKPKDTHLNKNKKINVETEYLKQLEDENLKLRIENAYLKELRRLRLEVEPQNKKRESSTASEDPSN